MPFFSLLYGIIDTTSRALTFVRAGQPNPILQEIAGQARLLRADGEALGAASEESRAEVVVLMKPRERLFIYADGVVEFTSPTMEQFGVGRLVKAIEATHYLELPNAVAALDKDLLLWRGNEAFDDDLCLLALEID